MFLFFFFILHCSPQIHPVNSIINKVSTTNVTAMKKYLFSLFLTLFSLNHAYAGSGDDLEALLSIDGVNNQQSNENSMPYKVECKQTREDTVKCTLETEKGAYVYKDSLKAECKNGIVVVEPLKKGTIHSDPNGAHETYEGPFTFKVNLIDVKKDSLVKVKFRGCDSDGICYPEGSTDVLINADFTLDKGEAVAYGTDRSQNTDETYADFIIMLLLALLLGAALDLTPCVFPMLTIYSATILGREFVSKAHSIRLNGSYLTGLALTYCIAGIIFSVIGVAAHAFLQHPVSVIVMAAALVVFALDCMGIITLKVPLLFNNKLQNKINAQKEGTATKAFIFGALSALITTPCTSAPLAGALIYVMNTNSLLKGSLLFLAIGIGMGLPLVLIGFFGNKFLSTFKGKGQIIRNLLAIPLLIAAVYVTEHLYQEYAAYVKSLVYAFCASYLIYTLKDLLKLKAPATICVLVFILLSNIFYKMTETIELPFTNIENISNLENYKGKKVLLTIGADWCSNCHALDKQLYATVDFKKAMDNVVLLRYDFTNPDTKESKEAALKFRLVGVPFAAVIDEDQNIVKTFTGGVSLEELNEALKK